MQIIVPVLLLTALGFCLYYAWRKPSLRIRLLKIKQKVCWNLFIKSYIIGFLNISFSTCVNIRNNFSRALDFSVVIAWTKAAVLLCSLIGIAIFLDRKRTKVLLSQIAKDTYGSFYADLNVCKPWSRLWSTLFLLRRFLQAAVLAFVIHLTLAVHFSILLSLLVLIYIIMHKPYLTDKIASDNI